MSRWIPKFCGLKLFALGAAVVLLAGCHSSSSSTPAPIPTPTGAATLSLTDAPADDCTSVVISITKLVFKVEGTEETTTAVTAAEETGAVEVVFDPPKTVELSALSGGLSFPLLAEYQIPAGTYDLIRAILDPAGCSVTVGSGATAQTYPLAVSGNYMGEPALLWVGSFTIAPDTPLDLTIDYDLRSAVVYQSGSDDYLLKPHYRIVDTASAASLYGTVDSTLMTPTCNGYVYLFSGSDVTPDDYDGNDSLLVASAAIDPQSGGYQFGFLPPGDYTLAFTCGGDGDDPETDDNLDFITTTAVTLAAEDKGQVDIERGQGGGGPTEETAGNNLAMPVIWGDGITKVLPGTYGAPQFGGGFWWYWTDTGGNPVVCEPGADCPEPLPEGAVKVFLQQDAGNNWQAETSIPTAPLDVSEIDWGDNLESRAWSTNSILRTEVVLYQDVTAAPLEAFEMVHLYGTGVGEMWGTTGTVLDSSEALVYSGCARLTIQKLTKTRDDPSLTLTWDAENALWTGDAGEALFSGAVWDSGDGPGYYSSEISVSGKLVYGYNWNVRNDGDGAGDYRLTFSLDGDNCPGTLNTFFTEGVTNIRVPVEEEVVTLAEDGSDLQGGISAIDFANNLTYIDVRITDHSGSGGGGGGGPGGGGGGSGSGGGGGSGSGEAL